MDPRKVFETGLLYHHYANTAYPLTPGSFRQYRLTDPAAIEQTLKENWLNTPEMALYVHVPFCQSRCRFCEYTVLDKTSDEIENRYTDYLLREIQMYSAFLRNKPVIGLDIGGGTPLKLSIENLTKIHHALFDSFNVSDSVERSIETTPLIAAREPEKIQAAFDLGFRRISMGIQTVSNQLLIELGREGTASLYKKAVRNIRKCGFKRFNVDLMYGFLHQSDLDLHNTIQYAIDLNPEFITLYRNRYKGTKIESESGGVSLYKAMRQYRLAYRSLIDHGFIANAGKNTFSRLPNNYGTSDYLTKRVIEGMPYVGMGLGAQSFGTDYLAYNEGAVSKKMDRYLQAIDENRLPIQDFYPLPKEETIAKMVSVAFYFGFIDYAAFEKRFGVKFPEYFEEETKFVKERGLMEEINGQLILTLRGADFVNGVIPLFYSRRSQEELLRHYEGHKEECADEQVFLSAYNIEKYDRPSVATDIAAITLRREEESENYRKDQSQHLSILLIKRGEHPFMNRWALPGGFLRKNETVEHCAQRELFEETGLNTMALFPLGCFSGPNRDPRGWILSNAFLSIVGRDDSQLMFGDDAMDARWFDLSYTLNGDQLQIHLEMEDVKFTETLRVYSSFGIFRFEIIPGDDVPHLAFDHAAIIATAIFQLRSELGRTELAFAFLPTLFTLSELQNLHEKIMNTREIPANFRRKMLPFVEKTKEMTSEAGHRPAALFRKKV
ncbi:MAG: radical SAM protein [Planctomycetia bacterium]|nr:radical SAM protein [Planctomycetia bacterium]